MNAHRRQRQWLRAEEGTAQSLLMMYALFGSGSTVEFQVDEAVESGRPDVQLSLGEVLGAVADGPEFHVGWRGKVQQWGLGSSIRIRWGYLEVHSPLVCWRLRTLRSKVPWPLDF